MQEKVLTAEQVAQILQVHPFTVLKFIKQGKLQASKLGRVYRIREKDLEYFLDHTSGRTPKSSDSEQTEAPTTVLKIRNKNKSPQILDQSKKSRAGSGQKNTSNSASYQGSDDQNEVIVTKVEKIDSQDALPKTGGDDHYFILK